MPVAKVQMPDGRIAKFEVPDGTTPEQVEQFAAKEMPKMGFAESFKSRLGQYAQLPADDSRQSFGGQLAADMLVGIPTEIAARRVAGQKLGPILAGGVQSAALPPTEGGSRIKNFGAGATTAAIIGGPISRGVQKLVAPVRTKLADAVQPLVEKAEKKFGLKLLPGQKTGDVDLRVRETGYSSNVRTQPRMLEIATKNQEAFNRALAKEMGVPNASKITPAVEQQARNSVIAQETRALSGKTLALDNQYINDIQAVLQNTNMPLTHLFGNKALKIVTSAGQLARMDGMDYKWLRSDLQSKASSLMSSDTPGNKEAGKALRQVISALDDAVDRAAGRGGNFTRDDLLKVKDARRKWKAILTVAESKRGNYDIDHDKWATKASDWYRPGEDMHDLIEIIDNIPDVKRSIGAPRTLTTAKESPSLAVSPTGGAQIFGHPLGMLSKTGQDVYMGLANTNYYTPAEMKRRAMAELLGAGAAVTSREPQLDYVTRR